MSRHSLFTPALVAGALSIGSTLALSTALAGEFPQGTFEAKEAPYTVSFDGKGWFQVNQGETLEVSGTYSIEQGNVELTDVKGPWACKGAGQQKGTYAWTFNGTTLTFIKMADSCDERSKTLVSATWQFQK